MLPVAEGSRISKLDRRACKRGGGREVYALAPRVGAPGRTGRDCGRVCGDFGALKTGWRMVDADEAVTVRCAVGRRLA